MQTICHFLVLGAILFTPIRTPILLPKDVDKTNETLAKECAKKRYFLQLSDELHKRFGFEVEPYEWPSRQPEIYYVSFGTTYSKEVLSLDQSRELIVEAVSFVLSYLNDNPEIIPFLAEYPMTPENMSFSIVFLKNLEGDDYLYISASTDPTRHIAQYQPAEKRINPRRVLLPDSPPNCSNEHAFDCTTTNPLLRQALINYRDTGKLLR